jgi:hypothetical protein
MGCFCHNSPLPLLLPKLNLSAKVMIPGANIPLSLSAWLSARGLPALPWQPEPGWLAKPLPDLRLTLQTVATISALAQVRAQALAQFGLDLLIPGQALAFARVVATMNVRLSALVKCDFNPLAWLRLAALNVAIDQTNLALRAGVLLPSPSLMLSLTQPGGLPMAQWGRFLASLRALVPLITAAAQLGVSLSETAQLAEAVQTLARLPLPALVATQLTAGLTAALNAVASLQTSLGVNPLELGLPAVQLRVSLRLQSLISALSAQFGLALSSGGSSSLTALLALLPNLPFVPTALVTAPTVEAALQARAVASLNLRLPLTLPAAVSIGLPTCALAMSLNTALGGRAVVSVPCAMGCDAARVMGALGTARAA